MAVAGTKDVISETVLSETFLAGSEEIVEFYCDPCRTDGDQLNAEGYCVDCSEYLCRTCIKYHRKTTATKKHALLENQDIPKNKTPLKNVSPMDVCVEECPDHSGKILEYYCKTHDKLGCSVCMTVNHRSCDGIDYIPAISVDIEMSQEYNDLLHKIKDVDELAEKSKRIAKTHAVLVDTYSDDTISQIKQLRKEVNELFDRLENDILKETQSIRDNDIRALTVVSDDCDSIRSDIKSISCDLGTKQAAKQNSHIFVTMKRAWRKLQCLEDKLRTQTRNKIAMKKYQFIPSSMVIDLTQELKNIGNLRIYEQDLPIVSRNQDGIDVGPLQGLIEEVTYDTEKKLVMKDPIDRQAEFVADVTVSTDTDSKPPTISGMVLHSNRQLATVDCANRSIKLIDIKQNKITSELKMSSYIWDITEVSDGQLAVTLPDKKRIQLMSVSDQLSETRAIQVEGRCRGIHFNEDRMFVTFDQPPKLEIIDTEGVVLKKFQTDKDGNPLFNDPWYIGINSNTSDLYVSDKGPCKLFCMAQDSTVKSSYCNTKLYGARGLTIDKYQLVYMCEYAGHRVHILSSDCTKAHILLEERDGLECHPYSIEYCVNEDKIYVGMDGNNTIKVFQMRLR